MALNGTYTPVTSNYTKVDNNLLYNSNISPQARYLYSLIQAQIAIPNYTVYKETLLNYFGSSEQRFDKCLKELKNLGLLIIHKLRDAKNQFYYQYELLPIEKVTKNKDAEKSVSKKVKKPFCTLPDPDFPPMELPQDEKATTWKNDGYNKTELNKTTINKTEIINTFSQDDDNDDRYRTSLSKNKQLKTDFTTFQKAWQTVTGKSILLSLTQKQQLNKLITTYSYQTVLCAVQKIKESHYLMDNINVMYFIKCFEKIYSDTYKDRVNAYTMPSTKPIQKVSTAQKSRFLQMDSRTWDFDELDRLEDEYIKRRIEKIRRETNEKISPSYA